MGVREVWHLLHRSLRAWSAQGMRSSKCHASRVRMILYILKAYCVGGSKCRALPLYTIKLTKTRALFILPRMWLGQWEYCPRLELCHTSYVQSYVNACTNTLDGRFKCFCLYWLAIQSLVWQNDWQSKYWHTVATLMIIMLASSTSWTSVPCTAK